MAWPPTTHQDAADEITSLRDGKGWASTLGGRQRLGEAIKSAQLLWLVGRWHQAQVVVGLTTFAPAASELRLVPLYIPTVRQIDRVSCNVSTAGTAGHVARMGIYNTDPATGLPTTVLVDSGTVAVDTTGVKEVVVSATLHGLYWLGLTTQSGTFTAYGTNVTGPVAGATSVVGSNANAGVFTSIDPTVALPDRTGVALSLGVFTVPSVAVRAA